MSREGRGRVLKYLNLGGEVVPELLPSVADGQEMMK